MGQREGMGGRGLLAGSAAFAAMGIAGAVHGGTHIVYVDASRPTDGDGTSWTQAFKDLQIAFDSVSSRATGSLAGDVVEFRIAQGTYRPQETRQRAFTTGRVGLTSCAAVHILGSYGGLGSPTPNARDFVSTATILTADVQGDDLPGFQNRQDNCHTVLESTNFYGWVEDFFVSGLTLQGATPSESLEGTGFKFVIANQHETPFTYQEVTIDDCVIRDNETAGLSFANGESSVFLTINMSRCHFDGNRSPGYGGGVALPQDRYAYLSDCQFTNNQAVYGGGGLFSPSNTVLKRCTFAGNSTQGNGGGLLGSSFGGSLELRNCLVIANSSSMGGGLWMADGWIEFSTIAHNSASYGGGMFAAIEHSPTFCILAHNHASIAGSQYAGMGSAELLQFNAIQDQRDGCYLPFDLDTVSQIRPFENDFADSDGPDNNAATWQDNDYRLQPRSRHIDAGFSTSTTELDLLRNPRRREGISGRGLRPDLGCYEAQVSLCPTDIDADLGVTIDDLLDFLVAFEAGQPLADLSTNGTTPFPDGGVTVDDLLFFLAKFEQGC